VAEGPDGCHWGRGVFDRNSGERVARDDRDGWTYLDAASGLAEGVGPLQGQPVRVAGLMTDRSLPQYFRGWRVSAADGGVVVSGEGDPQVIDEAEELRAFGFGNSGRWLAVATSSSLTVLGRGARSGG